ncbi:MAG: VOC family protein [Candidatus Micrarchaeota archaeon]|nr:VOC family protein [Candidatus Micrarchaeota archaeon]
MRGGMDNVVHFEIPAGNVARAKRFYSSVFGWRMREFPQMKYTMLLTGALDRQGRMPRDRGVINGGMMKRMGQIKSPVVTINVTNLDSAMKKVARAGGKVIIGKQKVGDMGWTAYIKDPEGNVMGLWQTARRR